MLTALTVLDTAEVTPPDLASALDTGAPEIDAAIAELREAGWFARRPGGGGDVLVDSARIWLSFDAPQRPAPDAAEAIAGRVLAAHAAALDGTKRADVIQWLSERRDAVLVAIRAGMRAGLHADAARLAAAAWPVAGEFPDPAWWRELARLGEDAAIAAREPQVLIELLDASAAVFEAAEDHAGAEEQRVRVAKLAYELGDHDRIMRSLSTLIELYRRWDRPGPAVDALLELADAQRSAGNAIGRAEALAELGYLMLAGGRAARADMYLETAGDIFDHALPGAVAPSAHARVLERRGRALWQLGHSIRARRCFTKALEVLGEDDPTASTRIRGLLDTHVDAPSLPEE